MKKRVIRFVTAITLVIAIASSSVLASGILAESKARETGKVDEGSKITETGKVDADANDGSKITETDRVDEDANSASKITEDEKLYEELDYYWFVEEEALRKIKEKYTVGTLCDLGAARGWKSIFSDGFLVFPLSEYEELDESLQFLNSFDIYIPTSMLSEMYPESFESLTINEYLFYWVDYFCADIRSRISEGTMPSTYTFGDSNCSINFASAMFFREEIFCAVADYYFGYDYTSPWS